LIEIFLIILTVFSDYFEKRSLITFTMLDGEKFGLVAGTWEITL